MGGAAAPDDLDAGHRTQVWLAVSDDPAADLINGQYFFHMKPRKPMPATHDTERQEQLLEALQEVLWRGYAQELRECTLPVRVPFIV